MVFSSLPFIYAFLPISLILYYLMPVKLRNHTLLFLSIVFCASFGLGYIMLILAYTLINYTAGLALSLFRQKQRYAAAGIITAAAAAVDVLMLMVFRENIIIGIDRFTEIVKPIGISFTVLSAIGYLLDVLSGRTKAERNLLNFAFYMMFFPRLPIGPLVNYSRFRRMSRSRIDGLAEVGGGLALFIKGLTKKVIFADNIYMLYSAVKSVEISRITALSAWLGILSYMFCIYFTLSGFSDMSSGLALCFGFHLPRSFNYPLISVSMNDFCKRWHIPVINWFRRYISRAIYAKMPYKPIKYIVIIFTWGIIGLWYDFRWNMLIWGMIIGSAIVCEQFFNKKKMLKATSIVYTFTILSVSAVFFFGDSLSYSLYYLAALIGGNNGIADSISIYLLKAYIVIVLVCAYAATDMFRNLIERAKMNWLRKTAEFLTPIALLLLLAICTADMSYTGVSEMMLPILREVA